MIYDQVISGFDVVCLSAGSSEFSGVFFAFFHGEILKDFLVRGPRSVESEGFEECRFENRTVFEETLVIEFQCCGIWADFGEWLDFVLNRFEKCR